jgi:hypothetical protein
MHPEFEVIAHMPDCRNGNCSTVWRNPTTGAVRLRGQDPNDPTREIDIEWSAADFAHLAPQLADFGAQ